MRKRRQNRREIKPQIQNVAHRQQPGTAALSTAAAKVGIRQYLRAVDSSNDHAGDGDGGGGGIWYIFRHNGPMTTTALGIVKIATAATGAVTATSIAWSW